MKTMLSICLLLAVVCPAPASAQILDTEPDKICFCVDPAGNVPGICDPFTTHTVYLLVTRPSDPSGLLGYRCSFSVPPAVIHLGFSPAGGIITLDVIFPDLIVGYGTPQPAVGDTYLLGTWNVLLALAGPDVVTLRQFQPGDPFFASYMTANSDQIPVRPPDWGNGMPMGEPWANAVLWVNEPVYCDYIVQREPASWGEVKSLYR